MKIRTLAVSILGVLLISSVSPAQETITPEPAATIDAKAKAPSGAQTRAQVEPRTQVEAAPAASSSAPQRAQVEAKTRAGAARAASSSASRRVTGKSPQTQVQARAGATRGASSWTIQRARVEAETRAEAAQTARSVATQRAAAIKPPTQVRIFTLKHITAEEAAKVIMNVLRIQAHPDKRTHSLIVSATQEEMESIESLMEALDVALPEDSTVGDVEDLVYRVYMFEIASGDRDMKSFSMILQVLPEVETRQLLDAAESDELQISGFSLADELDRDGRAEIRIQGKAASNAVLKRMIVDNIPESRIEELMWDDAETFTDKISAAQFGLLPEQMQKHIARLLGDEIRTVGYWFGNLSVPGSVEAPIGPWTLNLSLETESDRMLELRVDVEVPGEISRPAGRPLRTTNDEILSNTLRAKIGKPIIIGYNRESYGTRKMGAMVIVPEADSL